MQQKLPGQASTTLPHAADVKKQARCVPAAPVAKSAKYPTTAFACRWYPTDPNAVIEVFRRVTRLPRWHIANVLKSQSKQGDACIWKRLRSLMAPPASGDDQDNSVYSQQRAERRAQEVKPLLGDQMFHSYLDVGCGEMELTRHLARTVLQPGGKAYATDVLVPRAIIDIGEESKDAHNTHTEYAVAQFVLTDGCSLRFDTASADLVSCFHSLHHFVHLDKMLDEIGRVLRKDGDGVLIIREHDCPANAESKTHNLISLLHIGWTMLKDEPPVMPIHTSRPQLEWQRLLGERGFEPIGSAPTIAPTVDRLYLQAFRYRPKKQVLATT